MKYLKMACVVLSMLSLTHLSYGQSCKKKCPKSAKSCCSKSFTLESSAVKPGQTYTPITEISFKKGTATFEKEFAELDQLAIFLKEHASVNLEVRSVSCESKYVALAQERANAVKTALVEKGIDASRLVAKGHLVPKMVKKGAKKASCSKNCTIKFTVLKA